jgi:hypothetical protein
LTEINISPTKVRTYDGLIKNEYKDEVSYVLENKIQSTHESGKSNLYAAYTFYQQNTMNFYERRYKKIQDVISDIGGIFQVISIIAVFLNKIYNNFIILIDAEELISSLIKSEKNIIKNSKKSLYKFQSKIIEEEKKIKEDNNNLEKTKDELNKNNNDYDNKKNHNNNKKKKKVQQLKISDLEKLENLGKTKMEHNFWSYLRYKSPCNKKKYNFTLYEYFRIKILSEEHLVRNHINTYNLLKVTEKKRIARQSGFHLKDLINII